MEQIGPHAVVRVGVATLWTAPDRIRPVDEPATRSPVDVRGWVAAMSAADRDDLDGRTASQVLLGEPVLVTDVAGCWAKVVVPGQPADGLDPRGYPGWIPVAQLAPADAHTTGGDAGPACAAGPVVAVASTALRDAPDGDVVLPGVVLGTRLPVAGAVESGWVPVRVPGHDQPLWAREQDLAAPPAPGSVPDPTGVLATAERLLDAVYVWGGLSGYGIDCSGLVHLAWRRHGVTLPRDAADQAAATTPVPAGEERPGDLYFFARPGRRIHHVGLVAEPPGPDGARHMVHACGTNRRVLRERVTGERAGTLVAAHRVPPAPHR